MRDGYSFNKAIRGPIEDQLIPNGPEEDRTILDQIASSMAHTRRLGQSKNLIVELSRKPVRFEIILGDVFPNLIEVLGGARGDNKPLHPRWRRRCSDFLRISAKTVSPSTASPRSREASRRSSSERNSYRQGPVVHSHGAGYPQRRTLALQARRVFTAPI